MRKAALEEYPEYENKVRKGIIPVTAAMAYMPGK